MNAKQQGSALISVLIILLVITVLGVIAIRQGLTSLNIATSTQAQASQGKKTSLISQLSQEVVI